MMSSNLRRMRTDLLSKSIAGPKDLQTFQLHEHCPVVVSKVAKERVERCNVTHFLLLLRNAFHLCTMSVRSNR